MKKYLITLSLLFIIIFAATAQDNELKNNRFTIGSTINYNSSNFKNPNEINRDTPVGTTINRNIKALNSTLYIGIQTNENGLAGLIGLYEKNTSHYLLHSNESAEINDRIDKRLGIGLFYRQYFKLKSIFRFYAQPTSLYSKNKFANSANFSNPDVTINTSTLFDISVNFGTLYRIHPHWNILVNIWNINYQNKEEESGGVLKQESKLDLSFNIRNINLGAEYIF